MYPELITRPDLKIFLPPIGGISVYIFGPPEFISGSDICTCRPYLIYGMEECVKEAQRGGVGVIVYFRTPASCNLQSGKKAVPWPDRACLGPSLTTTPQQNPAGKRQVGGDTADQYFLRTECIAGVKDMRFQALMPDVLHWLGITKIDRMMSMSNMVEHISTSLTYGIVRLHYQKHDAIVNSGIPIIERVPIPDEMIPADSRVEIDAKIAAGYFSNKEVPTSEDLTKVKGRDWEDIAH
ncbi:hypothetical protein BC936DRAFT_141988 [Jimgerdemannia flammicorona]|uniref:Uncharacterized protein n=1 Tax=Jimgerdemannia flammicorona TaxID=994334 RepID=A0A433A186_9FUNG|nr:hypothetical protein BC936DRAFT_141988 [Jimgerdemannia flammicorona]